MKKIILITAAVMVALIILFVVIARGETTEPAEVPHIVYTYYNGHYLAGIAETPRGGYWARITIYVDNNAYVMIYTPIEADGTFHLWITSAWKYMTISVVDEPGKTAEPQDTTEEWPFT